MISLEFLQGSLVCTSYLFAKFWWIQLNLFVWQQIGRSHKMSMSKWRHICQRWKLFFLSVTVQIMNFDIGNWPQMENLFTFVYILNLLTKPRQTHWCGWQSTSKRSSYSGQGLELIAFLMMLEDFITLLLCVMHNLFHVTFLLITVIFLENY